MKSKISPNVVKPIFTKIFFIYNLFEAKIISRIKIFSRENKQSKGVFSISYSPKSLPMAQPSP